MDRGFLFVGVFLILGRLVDTFNPAEDMVDLEDRRYSRELPESEEISLVNKQIVFGQEAPKEVAIDDVIQEDLDTISSCQWMKLGTLPNTLVFLWQYSMGVYVTFGMIAFNDAVPLPIVQNNLPKFDVPRESLLQDGRWHHLCMTWEQTDGVLSYYEDGVLWGSAPGHGYVSSLMGIAPIGGGGTLTLGADRNDIVLHIAGFNLWSDVLDDSAILSLYKCEQNGLGDLFSWHNARIEVPSTIIQTSDVFLEDGYIPVCIGCTRYELRFEGQTFLAARSTCQAIGSGAMLAKIADNDTQQSLVSGIRALCTEDMISRGLWIGLNDIDVQGTYFWGDGAPLVETGYQNWAPGEPNNKYKDGRGYQNCVQMWKRKEFQWDDDWCAKRKTFICQSDFC